VRLSVGKESERDAAEEQRDDGKVTPGAPCARQSRPGPTGDDEQDDGADREPSEGNFDREKDWSPS
jgi:hypothetical protein